MSNKPEGRQASKVSGNVSVPREPTDEMALAGSLAFSFDTKKIYAAMIATAPIEQSCDVEVIGYFYKGDHMGDQFDKRCLKHYYRRSGAAEHEYIQPVELVDRAHVTRLQAENQRLKAGVELDMAEIDRIQGEYDKMFRKFHSVKSELTKARELLLRAVPSVYGDDEKEIRNFLANQSAPAAKCNGNHGGPRCADPECWNDAPAAKGDQAPPTMAEQCGASPEEWARFKVWYTEKQSKKGEQTPATMQEGTLGSTCNEVREEGGLPLTTQCKACNGGACIDR